MRALWPTSLFNTALILIMLLLLLGLACANTEIILVKSPGCHKCAAAENTINGIVNEDRNITLVEYDYFTDDGHRIIKEYQVKDIPSIIIGKQVIGYKTYNGDTAKLEAMIKAALANQSSNQSATGIININGGNKNISSINNTGGINNTHSSQTNRSLNLTSGLSEISLGGLSASTIATVLAAGLIAGFNPCLLAILVFLSASVLSSTGRRRELATMIVSFSLGIFTIYFVSGLGMQRLLQGEAVVSGFRYILVVFLVVLGLAQVEDARRLRLGRGSLFRTDWVMKYVEAGVSSGRHRYYFLVGALFSLVKLPCIGAVYLAILDLITSKSYFEGAIYLLFYNLGIILPIIILGGFIALGMSPEQVNSFRKEYRAGIRLATGLTLLALAPLVYWQII